MTPYEIGVILHYYISPEDHPDTKRSPASSAHLEHALATLYSEDLLTQNGSQQGRSLLLTERGKAYAEALQQVPLPVQKWVTIWPDAVEI